MTTKELPADLVAYVETTILPRYAAFDAAHREDHAHMVIEQSMQIVDRLLPSTPVSRAMAYAIAAYHDLGLSEGRTTHHVASARIIRADAQLRRWFTEDQVSIMADAAEDHRASINKEPRSIYGKIVAEADRDIYKEKIVRRTIEFGIDNYPGLDKEGYWQRTLKHLHEKYAEGGYIKLWLPKSPNEKRLEELRNLIKDETKLRTMFEEVYEETARGER